MSEGLSGSPLFRRPLHVVTPPAAEADAVEPEVPAPAVQARAASTPWAGLTVAGAAPTAPMLDPGEVKAFRRLVTEQLADRTTGRNDMAPQVRRELGRELIARSLRDDAAHRAATGLAARSAAEEAALRKAIFDAAFGVGYRLQPLLELEDVDNIEAYGHDDVWLEHAGGVLRRGPAIADSDEELISDLQFIAARHGSSERSFSPANPTLDLSLQGIGRLSATAWCGGPPDVTIRRHRYKKVDLDQLVRLGMIDQVLAEFLRAAVLAGKSIVIAGPMGAGKTTMVRALCACIPRLEKVATIETEFELFLSKKEHERLLYYESRPGSGEMVNGRRAGQLDLEDLLYFIYRKSVDRVICGEVRGREVQAYIEAIQSTAGSMTTVHAHTARGAVDRLVTLAMKAGPHVTAELATRQLTQFVDFVVQVRVRDDRQEDAGHRYRYVAEVIELTGSVGAAGTNFSSNNVFVPGPDGRAVPQPGVLSQQTREDLEAVGFDSGWFQHTAGTWATPLPASRPRARRTGTDRD